MRKNILLLIAAAILVGGFGGWALVHRNSTSTPAPTSTATATATANPDLVSYDGVEGKNALDLLKEKHTILTTHYSFGDMVTSIDGKAADAKHFWGFYVNGKSSDIGASAYTTKAGDKIEWKYDAQ